MAHPKIELVNDSRADDADPVGGPSIVFVKIMRTDSPPVHTSASVGPSRGAEALVIRSPPLSFPIDAVFICGFEINANHRAAFRNVHALLVNIASGNGGSG